MSTINIDQAWLDQRVPPYALDTKDAMYVLQEDVATPGTAFVVCQPNVTLDLNGHSVTYGNASKPALANPDFSVWSGDNPTYWSFYGTAFIAPTQEALLPWPVNLRMTAFKQSDGPQVLTSAPVLITQAGHTYAASVATTTPRGTQSGDPLATVRVDVLSTQGQLLALGSDGGGYNAAGSLAEFFLAQAASVVIRITVTALSDSPTTIDLGRANLCASYDYGVLASNYYNVEGHNNLPPQMQWGGAQSYGRVGTFTLASTQVGGTLIQGLGAGRSCHAIMAKQLNSPLSITKVNWGLNGDECCFLYANGEGGTGSSATRYVWGNAGSYYPLTDVVNRMRVSSCINLARSTGQVSVANNKAYGFPQVGLWYGADSSAQGNAKALITDNILQGSSVVTNAGAVLLYACRGVLISNNTLSGDCEGVVLDSQSRDNFLDVELAANKVDVTQTPLREYGSSLFGRALRVRNDSGPDKAGAFSNLYSHDNLYCCRSVRGCGASGGRFTLVDTGNDMLSSGILSVNDHFKGIAMDAQSRAVALDLGAFAKGVYPAFIGSTLESNILSLALSSDAGNPQGCCDVLLSRIVFYKSPEGVQGANYQTTTVGYWTYPVGTIHILGARCQGGAALSLAYPVGPQGDVRIA
jgi:hypothetical protein